MHALNNEKEPRKTNSFEYGWNVGMSLVKPQMTRRHTQQGIQVSIKKKIELFTEKGVNNDIYTRPRLEPLVADMPPDDVLPLIQAADPAEEQDILNNALLVDLLPALAEALVPATGDIAIQLRRVLETLNPIAEEVVGPNLQPNLQAEVGEEPFLPDIQPNFLEEVDREPDVLNLQPNIQGDQGQEPDALQNVEPNHHNPFIHPSTAARRRCLVCYSNLPKQGFKEAKNKLSKVGVC